MPKSYIEFRNVSKNYREIKALNNVNFKIFKGDIFGYIGPNGAGKTTTIKILVGLIQNFKGEIFIDGKNVSEVRSELYKILGYLPQNSGFQNWRTVEQTLKTLGKLSGLSSAQLKDRIDSVLELVNLKDVRNRKIAHLSGGMIQKLLLAQSILHEPELLVLDEPMSGLDPTSRFQFKKIIKDLSNNGMTIFFSSHILSDVQDIATRIGIINKGKIMRVGTPDELQSHFQVGNDIEIIFAEDRINLQPIKEMEGIKEIDKVSPKKIIIRLYPDIDIDKCIKDLLDIIIKNNLKIRNFNVMKPSLEEVYLKYVGSE
ncbi:MAG: ATP-binding cassette domain-containing protein [Candidatus Helarchaeota archaeon]